MAGLCFPLPLRHRPVAAPREPGVGASPDPSAVDSQLQMFHLTAPLLPRGLLDWPVLQYLQQKQSQPSSPEMSFHGSSSEKQTKRCLGPIWTVFAVGEQPELPLLTSTRLLSFPQWVHVKLPLRSQGAQTSVWMEQRGQGLEGRPGGPAGRAAPAFCALAAGVPVVWCLRDRPYFGARLLGGCPLLAAASASLGPGFLACEPGLVPTAQGVRIRRVNAG